MGIFAMLSYSQQLQFYSIISADLCNKKLRVQNLERELLYVSSLIPISQKNCQLFEQLTE